MYAGTRVNWHEILMPESNKAAIDDSLPLFLCVFSADKGTEAITDFVQSDFLKMYGTKADFSKYGQPLLQAHRILQAGGRVLGKRIVAKDASLANIIITAEVTDVASNKKDKDGNQLYTDDNGKTFTTDPSKGKPAIVHHAKVKFNTVTMENAMTAEAVIEKANSLQTESVFPLFAICDNGRGKSVKKIRIVPDYVVAKKLPHMVYRLIDVENASIVESIRFAIDPKANHVVNGRLHSMKLDPTCMIQLDPYECEAGMNAFMEKLQQITDYSIEDLYHFDVLFGRTVKGKPIASIEYDVESKGAVDLQTELGLFLESGTNGKIGDAPWLDGKTPGNEDAWTTEAIEFMDGTFSAEIYDLDQHKIDFCVDAAYPDSLKNAIVDLADFRGDFFYFRDLGLNINNIEDVVEKVDDLSWPHSKFVGDYESTYDIIEEYNHKQVKVTMCLGIAPLLVQHYSTNVAAPVAGEFNNFIVTDALPNTLNIIPRVTPTYDQKEILDDLRVNFLNLTSDYNLAVQSTYTSQEWIGPLSYVNNVIVTQMVIKAIRRYCPKIRFMLMDPGATDFGKYKTLIEDNVIDRFSKHFKHIELRYTRDDEEILSKIFHASLYCYYRDFPQAEIFDVFAIEGSPDTNPIRETMR